MNERAAANDVLASDDEAIDSVRRGEHEPRHEIDRPCELEHVGPPDGEVRALPGLERADVVPAEDGRAAACSEPQRLANGQRSRSADPTGDEECLLHLEEEVAALVGRRAVDAEPDANTGVEVLDRKSVV